MAQVQEDLANDKQPGGLDGFVPSSSMPVLSKTNVHQGH